MKLSENKPLTVLRWIKVYFKHFDEILLVPAQNIIIE